MCKVINTVSNTVALVPKKSIKKLILTSYFKYLWLVVQNKNIKKMEDLTRTSIEQGSWIILAIILVITFIIIFAFFPKKKHCSDCGKKTRNKNGVCKTCTNERLLQKARIDSPHMLCHIHGETMDARIILGIEDVVVHTCPNPTCTIMIMDKKNLVKLAFLDLQLYPPESKKEETS